jgi:hypothetical protein
MSQSAKAAGTWTIDTPTISDLAAFSPKFPVVRRYSHPQNSPTVLRECSQDGVDIPQAKKPWRTQCFVLSEP